ncbi:Oidioi.mRNA.OKI2018_I69.XSR.g14258.t1.cds [Oikopleura dioica]|uniref:Oidioi.mRNA.OKI2018_I69.XSR.g14258.t1.cds n=1 Tax=Oikopleura dioica TaxID=34765 RepID=A0ABN7S982_OIKDI|nr:Oidioi.mRNA.OKI2018_I69.XSR.g14258.t1.cds [Oikopleura dioica]
MNLLRAINSGVRRTSLSIGVAQNSRISARAFSQTPSLLVKEQDLKNEIEKAFPEGKVSVEDASNGCGTNFNIQVICDSFEGKRAVNRNRMVNKVIKPYMQEIHMIRVETFTKSEFDS